MAAFAAPFLWGCRAGFPLPTSAAKFGDHPRLLAERLSTSTVSGSSSAGVRSLPNTGSKCRKRYSCLRCVAMRDPLQCLGRGLLPWSEPLLHEQTAVTLRKVIESTELAVPTVLVEAPRLPLERVEVRGFGAKCHRFGFCSVE